MEDVAAPDQLPAPLPLTELVQTHRAIGKALIVLALALRPALRVPEFGEPLEVARGQRPAGGRREVDLVAAVEEAAGETEEEEDDGGEAEEEEEEGGYQDHDYGLQEEGEQLRVLLRRRRRRQRAAAVPVAGGGSAAVEGAMVGRHVRRPE